nr:MAG TPA: hypothetical protein [Caudoviricetes sp.]
MSPWMLRLYHYCYYSSLLFPPTWMYRLVRP